ncbi:hypothetical protein BDR03DRAFT_1006306 [Suillus americanus]|nr:hypothetical protein BDR03DRAFT_1006306 [Suillus americanus]
MHLALIFPSPRMSTRAKATLAASLAFSSFIIWAVHHQQSREREDMFQGVIRDDARRLEKMRQREEEFRESSRRREMYEQVQNVVSSDQSNKI